MLPINSPIAADTVLNVEDLQTFFYTEEGKIRAVNGDRFTLRRGRVLALVGESGCSKRVTSYSILRLIRRPGRVPPEAGSAHRHRRTRREIRRPLPHARRLHSMILQEPMTALSPVHTVGNQICEAILLHQDMGVGRARELALEMFCKVGIPGAARRIDQYPHVMSGGMLQRVVIAMALVCNPGILIADEPTTALDVTIQAQILKLTKALQNECGTSVIFITHNLGVVAQVADDVR